MPEEPVAHPASVPQSLTLPPAENPFFAGPPLALWPAHWIAHPSSTQEPNSVFLFRRHFDLAAVPAAFPVRVTADNRFELYVNGTLVARGPARCDVEHWRYDVVDLAPYLHSGTNLIAAVTWFLDYNLAPWAQMGHAPGFLLCADGPAPAQQAVNTGTGWKTLRAVGYTFLPLDRRDVPYYCVVGPGEQLNGAQFPWGWETSAFDDTAWQNAAQGANGTPRGARDGPGPWNLVANPLPRMEETRQPVTRVARAEGVAVENNAFGPSAPVHIPANTKAVLLLDNGVLTTGYPELSVEGGQGATVRMRYSEALWGGANNAQKGNRNEVEGRMCRGYHDAYLPDTPVGQTRAFRPLWWRTFRYLQIEVETQATPLVLHGLTNVFSAFPFMQRGHFTSSNPELARIWEVGWRTARLCAHETYMDCPYYEQLQYGGDTRIQCLVSLYAAGDDRLMRNAIVQLDDSRLPDGITQSRYPSHQAQIIPPFALWWVGMIHDFFMYRDDPAFVRARLSGARATVEWFIAHLDDNDLLGPLPWWNFVDWTPTFASGVPPGVGEGGSSILSLQLVLALRELGDMEDALGLPANARRYRDLARRVAKAVHTSCWDANRHLLADTPRKDKFSQHANVLAILADALPASETRRVGTLLNYQTLPPIHLPKPIFAAGAATTPQTTTTGAKTGVTVPATGTDNIAPATFYFRFYLHRALRKAGFGEHYLDWLHPWRDMLALGLTTWAEKPEPTRSDCHAWSAHPNVDLLATVLGVESDAPGFARVRIAPHLGALPSAEGTVPHPKGEIHVKLERQGDKLAAQTMLPEGVTGLFHYGGAKYSIASGYMSFVTQSSRARKM